MWVRFWGTRGSIAKAGPSTVRYGGNTSCVEVRSASGTLVVLDCGTGAHGLGKALLQEPEVARKGHLLISHTHWDHIQGVPFFAPFFGPGNEWHVYGPQSLGSALGEVLAGQMEYTYFPITPEQFRADLTYHDLVEGVFHVGDIRVTARYLNHPALTLGYRLEADGVTVVYATDHEPHLRRMAGGGIAPAGSADERHGRFLAGADLVIHDTQYTAEEYPDHVGWGHSTMEYVVDLSDAAAVRRLALFHHDPMRRDDALDRLVEQAQQRAGLGPGKMQIVGAAEGHRIDVRPTPKRGRVPLLTPAPAAVAQPPDALHDAVVVMAVADAPTSAALRQAAGADGLRVLEPDDDQSLLELVEQVHPRVVVMDRAAAGDAFAVCDALHQHDPTLPLVVVADDHEIEPENGTAAGVSEWLATPFSPVYARTRLRCWCMRSACRWRKAPRPEEEEARLASLRRLDLDDAPEERFDRFTRLAGALFGTSSAAINFVDADRQWTKSAVGIDAAPMPRDVSMCAHVILSDDVLQIPDLLTHDTFADNPAVYMEPPVRFYAGAPITLSDGGRVGVLCVQDQRPRRLSEEQEARLRDLAALIARELERAG